MHQKDFRKDDQKEADKEKEEEEKDREEKSRSKAISVLLSRSNGSINESNVRSRVAIQGYLLYVTKAQSKAERSFELKDWISSDAKLILELFLKARDVFEALKTL